MIFPRFIEKGDTIGVTACSDGRKAPLDMIRMDHAKEQFEKVGYSVLETANCRNSEKGRSSDAAVRAKQLESLLLDDKVKGIIMCSGGDYLLEMISKLDFGFIREHPKWIQGFSDPTGLLYTLTVNLELATLYASNFGDFGMEEWHPSLHDNIKFLEGAGMEGENGFKQNSFTHYMDGYREKKTGLEGYEAEKEVCWENLWGDEAVHIKGRMLGGCLDVLLNLVGTKYDKTKEFCEKYRKDGILWYFESFDLNSERLFLGLWQLKEAGWFETAKGFMFGRPTFYSSSYDISYEESLKNVLGELSVPVIMGADFGHKPPRMTIANGSMGEVFCSDKSGYLIQKLV